MQRLQQRSQRLDELGQRLLRATDLILLRHNRRLELLQHRLLTQSPDKRLERLRLTEQQLETRLRRAMQQILDSRRSRLAQLARDLNTLSPLNTLGRGYAIVQRERDGQILRQAGEAEPGEQVKARLAEGSLICRVIERED